tara:strand:+ start:2853 stop:3755 length:903 start_codon:yes stop_codon:yes gene_type:complete
MTSSTVLVTSAAIELLFEGIIDALALDVESRNGVDLDLFWGMWRRNAVAFWGLAVTNSFVSILAAVWAFKQVPTVAFCTSPTDPCSCEGGGFEILETFCNATTAIGNSTETSAPANESSVADLTAEARAEYKGIFEALGVDAAIIIVSIGVGIIVVVVFFVARIILELAKVNDEKAKAEQRAAELRETNLKIQDQLMLTQLNAKQVAVVEANSSDLDTQVPAVFKLNWRFLLFEARLGSGSFGDCFKGRWVFSDLSVMLLQIEEDFCKTLVVGKLILSLLHTQDQGRPPRCNQAHEVRTR